MLKYDRDVSVKIHPELAQSVLIQKLAKDFKAYKITGENTPLFGRDVPFSEVSELENSNISKVHIIELDEYEEHRSQYQNKSDSVHLIYCQHFMNDNSYCIIHVLSPQAHKLARTQEFISVAVRRAEEFHKSEAASNIKKVSNS